MIKTILRCSLLIIPFCFCIFLSFSQNDPVSYQKIFNNYQAAQHAYDQATAISAAAEYDEAREEALNKKALSLFRQTLSLIPPKIPLYDSLKFFSAFRIGEIEHYFEHFNEALTGYHQSINIHGQSRLSDSLLFRPYLYSGIIYYNRNNYDSATLYFSLAEKVQQQFNYRLTESERLYNTFGALYYEKGDYRQASNYFNKALETLSPTHPYYKELFVNYKVNLAQIYFKLEDYDEANKIYKELQPFGINKNEINHNLGMINLYLGAAGKALDYFRKVNYSGNKIIWLYANMGIAFLNLEEKDSARLYFQKAAEANQHYGSNTDHIAYGLSLKGLGDLELLEQHAGKALTNYQKAIRQFYPSYGDTSARANPEKFSGVFSYINLFETLVAKAEAFHLLYIETHSMQWAEEELKTYSSAFRLIDYVERTYNSDEARLFLDKTKYLVHGKPIDIAFDLYRKTKDKKYLETLYIFDQQNKASVLSLKQSVNEQLHLKDSSLAGREGKIRSDITRLSLQAMQLSDEKKLAELNKNIRDKEIELGKVQDQSSYPAAGAEEQIPSIHSLQKDLLDDQTALLSFHLYENRLTTLVITSQSANCYQQTLFPDFHERINNYIRNLHVPEQKDSSGTGALLFHLLFDSVQLKGISRLVLIPDDELNYLSFESLEDENGKYLVDRYSIQYHYSTALIKKEKLDLSGHETLAFAPFASKAYKDTSLELEQLSNSGKEISGLKGRKYLDTMATKSRFLAELGSFKVLHLATHAVVNNAKDNLSFIAFNPANKNSSQDFLLYEEEIYNLSLQQTELIILSACETASGDLVKGEGIMSLSRAFTYAGCPNIITTLWSANDFSTAYLTDKIHYYIDKHYSIDRALQQAKKDYLADPSINPRLKHPYYWSHLVFIGNYEPTESSSYWWVLLFPIIAIVLLLWRRRSRIKRVQQI